MPPSAQGTGATMLAILRYGCKFIGLSMLGLGTAVFAFSTVAKRQTERLEHRLNKRDAEVASLKGEVTRLVAELEERNKAWVSQQLEAVEAENKIKDQEAVIIDCRTREEHVRGELREVLEEKRAIGGELESLRRAYTQSLDALEMKRTEMDATHGFLNAPDVISETDVVDMLNVLNSEISRVALSLTQLLPFRERQPQEIEDIPETLTEEWENVSEIFGTRAMELLVSVDHGKNSTLVQNMIQAYIGVYVVWMVTSWHLEPLGEENILAEIYDSLRDNENQLVSGRWRELTRKHIDRIMPSTSYLSEHFVEAAVNVLVVAGSTASRETIHETIHERLSDDMASVLNQVFRIKKAIGQDVTSSEMELISVPEDQPFEEETMDVFSDWYVRGVSGAVVCMTSSLGLRAVCESDVGRDWETIILLKPRVIVNSQLESLVSWNQASESSEFLPMRIEK